MSSIVPSGSTAAPVPYTRLDGFPQHVPRIDVEWLAVLLDVGDPDDRVVLPTGAERVAIDERLDVGQPDVELLTRDVQDLPVGREREHADAERRPAVVGHVAEQVLATFDAEHVRVEQAETFALDVHRTLLSGSRRA